MRSARSGPRRTSGPNAGNLQDNARVKQVYYRLGQKLVPAYYSEFIGRSGGAKGANGAHETKKMST